MKILFLILISLILSGTYGQGRKEYYDLSPQEIKVLEKQINTIPDTLKTKFNTLFERWKQNWLTNPATMVNSSTTAAVKLQEFDQLLKLGKDTLPLLMDKLRDKENFIGVLLYQRLQPDSIQESTLMSEQKKAEIILRKWLEKKTTDQE